MRTVLAAVLDNVVYTALYQICVLYDFLVTTIYVHVATYMLIGNFNSE
jgi:hypothetical protein